MCFPKLSAMSVAVSLSQNFGPHARNAPCAKRTAFGMSPAPLIWFVEKLSLFKNKA